MNLSGLILFAPIIALLSWAAIVDLRARRIPNWLTFSIALSGLTQCWTANHLAGPVQSLLGFAAGFALPFVLFAIGALGGGDVKLLAGVGAWLGPEAAIKVFLLAAVFGMIIVLTQAIAQGRTLRLFRNSAMIAMNAAHVGELGVEHVAESGKACRSVDRPLPYAVPVLIATLVLVMNSRV
jgi:prepilin peptidase CpaA